MYRTPSNKSSSNAKEVANEERAGPSPREGTSARNILVDIDETMDEIETQQQEPKTPPMAKRPEETQREETPRRHAPLPKIKPPLKVNTFTISKKIANTETPSPIKSPRTAKEFYPNKMAEARAVYKKGVQNLEKFKNLRASVKVELRKALDRLYALINDGPAVRNLEKQINEDTPPTKTKTMEQTENLEKILEDHASLLKGNIEMMEKLKKSIDKAEDIRTTLNEHKESLERITYASVVGTKPTVDTNKEKLSLHSVVISSKNDQSTGEEVLEEVRRAINAKEGWIKIERVRKAKDRKIVVGCASAEERKRVKERIEETAQHLVVEEVKNRDPLLVIKDVLSNHSDEEILKALKNQNHEIFHALDNEEERIAIKYRKRARNPHTCHIVLTVSPTIWRRALDMGRLRVDLQKL